MHKQSALLIKGVLKESLEILIIQLILNIRKCPTIYQLIYQNNQSSHCSSKTTPIQWRLYGIDNRHFANHSPVLKFIIKAKLHFK